MNNKISYHYFIKFTIKFTQINERVIISRISFYQKSIEDFVKILENIYLHTLHSNVFYDYKVKNSKFLLSKQLSIIIETYIL